MEAQQHISKINGGLAARSANSHVGSGHIRLRIGPVTHKEPYDRLSGRDQRRRSRVKDRYIMTVV